MLILFVCESKIERVNSGSSVVRRSSVLVSIRFSSEPESRPCDSTRTAI